jgi:hypothetical protein
LYLAVSCFSTYAGALQERQRELQHGISVSNVCNRLLFCHAGAARSDAAVSALCRGGCSYSQLGVRNASSSSTRNDRARCAGTLRPGTPCTPPARRSAADKCSAAAVQ